MSESEDKRILKMLEENKINAAEAQKLLEALRNKKSSAKTEKRESNFSIKNINGFINSLSIKAAAIKEKASPAINEVFGNVKEKSTEYMDMIFSSLGHESSSLKPSSFKEFDIEAESGADLCFKVKNGELNLIGYNGKKISGRIYFKSKNSSPEIEIVNYKNRISVKYDDSEFSSVYIDAIIPYNCFNSIELYNYKGSIKADNLSCKNFKAENESGKIKTSKILAQCGKIEADNSDICMDFNLCPENTDQLWNIEANNTSIEIYSAERKNVYISANSILGEVEFDDKSYEAVSGKGSNISLKSKNKDSEISNLKLDISSSNNYIKIK